MKNIVLLAAFLISLSVPCLAELCNLSRGQRQQLVHLLNQAAATALSEDPVSEAADLQSNNLEEFYEAR